MDNGPGVRYTVEFVDDPDWAREYMVGLAMFVKPLTPHPQTRLETFKPNTESTAELLLGFFK